MDCQVCEKGFDPWKTNYSGKTYRLCLETYDENGDWNNTQESVSDFYDNADDCYRFYNGLDRHDITRIIRAEASDKFGTLRADREIRLYIESEWFDEGESTGGEWVETCASFPFYWRNGTPVIQWNRSNWPHFTIDDYAKSPVEPVEEVIASPNNGNVHTDTAPSDGEKESSYDVELASFGDKKIAVIKVVRKLTGLSLKDAKETVDGAPKFIIWNATKEDAEAAKKELEDVGAIVTLK